MGKTCNDCRHCNVHPNDNPCRGCINSKEDHPNWEPEIKQVLGREELNAMIKASEVYEHRPGAILELLLEVQTEVIRRMRSK